MVCQELDSILILYDLYTLVVLHRIEQRALQLSASEIRRMHDAVSGMAAFPTEVQLASTSRGKAGTKLDQGL